MNLPETLTPSERLFALTVSKHVPFSFTVEITNRCPLACVHCYLPETQGRAPARRPDELTTDEWKSVFDQLAAAGCLYLVITGGEILLRPDAVALAAHARSLGFDTRLFTTGVLLTESQADELAALDLSAVELSVYGRPEVHDRITLRPGSYEKTMRAVDMLTARGVTTVIKCPMMKENFSEREFLVALGQEKGVRFKADPTLAPGNDRGREMLGQRLEPEQVMDMLDDPNLISQEKIESVRDDYHDNSFLCSAGKNLGGINPFGDVFPCLQLPVVAGNLREKSFEEIWHGSPELAKIRGIHLKDIEGCNTCEIKDYCSRCPGMALLEDGNVLGPSTIACQLAKAQYERVNGPTDYVPAGLRPDFKNRSEGCNSCTNKELTSKLYHIQRKRANA